jgi:23S rRNA A2030 N6-methylase RlmJ
MKNNRSLHMLLFAVLIGTYLIFCLENLTPRAHAHKVEQEYVSAIKQLNQNPPGVARAEGFIKQIKSINVEHAPLEMQQDMRKYADALDKALQAFKDGRDSTIYDQKSAEEKAKLVADFRKYDIGDQ